MPENNLREIHCFWKECRAFLCKTDGKKFFADDPKVLSKLLTNEKKRANPLYCVKCHRITRWYNAPIPVKQKKLMTKINCK